LRNWAFILALALSMTGLPSAAHAEDDIRYTVVKGDTLIGFGKKYLVQADQYRVIQRSNRLADPHKIPVGTIIRVPRRLLKFQPSTATLTSVRGQVLAGPKGAERDVVSGVELGEGQRLRTSAGSFATMTLEDGSRISLPSNSDLRILRLRRYLLGATLDYDFQVDRGSARSKVVPQKGPNDSYRMRTPKAVSAVRGTDFDARFDDVANRDFAEVVDGALAVNVAGSAAAPLRAGNGLAVNADGKSIREALLPRLEITNAGRPQTADVVRFALPSAPPGGTRVTIATDAGFQDIVVDTATLSQNAEIGMIEDGNYFARFRAISAAGLEGMPSIYAFKRRQNSVSGSSSSSADGWQFKWSGAGKGVIRYHFQLYRGTIEGPAFVDEAGLTEKQISLSDLPLGDYFWRVGSMQYIDGEANMNWTDFEKFAVSSS
jgi:hypothetical protein